MPSSGQLYLLISPVCIAAIGCLLALSWLHQRRSIFLLSTASGLLLTGIALGWQSVLPKAELSKWAIFTGPLYLVGAWLCTLGIAQKFSVPAYPKIAGVVGLVVLAILYVNSVERDNIAVRALWLNIGLGIIHFLPFPAIFFKSAKKDELETLLYWVYGVFAIYTMLRPVLVLILGFTEIKDMAASIYWVATMLGSLLFSLLISALLLAVALRDDREILKEERNHDVLTGLLNRRAFWEVAEERVHDRRLWPVSILMGDIDHFKRVNDTWGHEQGDLVLQAVSATLLECVRRTDVVTRFGGEEFVLMLTNSDLAEAERVAQRIRKKVSENGYVLPQGQRITMSFGISAVTFGLDVREAVNMADKQLYKAKASGRDKVVVGHMFVA